MIDCSAAGQAESEPVDALIARWMPQGCLGHVQVNDPNRRGPGQGAMDFGPILRVLRQMEAQGHFPGIVAVEPFDYVPDGPGCGFARHHDGHAAAAARAGCNPLLAGYAPALLDQ